MDLIIGYGNTLRGDDGAGPRIAEAVESWNLPGVRVLAVPQLTPELAADIAAACRVVFVDAAWPTASSPTPEEITLVAITPFTGSRFSTHFSDARGLLALAAGLYAQSPEAYLLTIPGRTFEIGTPLSEATQAGIEAALRALRVLLTTITL